MPKILKNIALSANRERLIDEIKAQYPNMVYRFSEHSPTEPYLEIDDASADSGVLDTIIAAHNPAVLTNEQTKAIARTLMLSDAKNYLSAQLQSANPNVQTIFNTVKAYVDGNPTLAQMLTNQIALFNSAYSVTINTTTPTAADRARYLLCCQLVLGTIA